MWTVIKKLWEKVFAFSWSLISSSFPRLSLTDICQLTSYITSSYKTEKYFDFLYTEQWTLKMCIYCMLYAISM